MEDTLTDKWKYRSVSLKNSTYSLLNDLTTKLVPDTELSNAKVVDMLIRNKAKCISSGDLTLTEKNNGIIKKEEE